MKLKLNIPETTLKEMILDVLPRMLNSKTKNHELVLELSEKKEKNNKIPNGKITINKRGANIILKGKVSEIELDPEELKKIKKLI